MKALSRADNENADHGGHGNTKHGGHESVKRVGQ